MNKEELIKQFDEKLQQLRDEFISKLEDDKKEFELTYPEDGETVYYIDSGNGEIYDTVYSVNNTADKYMFEHGLYFKTEEEAEQFLKESKLIFKMKQWAKRKNDGWEPGWKIHDNGKNYITHCEFESPDLSIERTWSINRFSKLPYFKTIKIAKECIDLFGDEIKEVFVNGK